MESGRPGPFARRGELQLSTEVWVMALIRRANLAGAAATVARKGDLRAGAVVVRTFDRQSGEARLFSEAVRGSGERVWMQPRPGAGEAELEAYVERQARIDPDLWVVDVEAPEAWRFLTEPVEKA
jgi:hypothetical protein